MATEKWIAGTVSLTWATIMSTELNSIANGNAILATTALDNSSNLDLFADFSVHLASLTPTGVPFVALFLYPLNDDGSTYGDGRFGASASGTPPGNYYIGSVPVVATVGAQNGTIRGVIIPPGSFKLVLWNQTGPALASSGNTVKWRTYDRSIL